jgi:hypothetical protein
MDRALLDSPPKLTPPAKLAGTRLASDENNPTLPTMRPSRRWGTRFWRELGGTEGRSNSLGQGKLSAVEALAARLSGRGPLGLRRSADIQRLAHLTPAAWFAQHS